MFQPVFHGSGRGPHSSCGLLTDRNMLVGDWASKAGKGKSLDGLVIGCMFSKLKYSVLNGKGLYEEMLTLWQRDTKGSPCCGRQSG